MISRQWRGLAMTQSAEAYVKHLQLETFSAVAQLSGFISASILRRAVSDGVEFLIVTNWNSLEHIRAFAGNSVERAVVPKKVQEMMIAYDRTVRHYEIVQ